MTLDYFKDILFDTINESDRMQVVDIISDDRESTFIIKMWGGTFLLKCSEHVENNN